MATRQLTLTLSEETIRTIEDQVASGRYTDASEVVEISIEGLRMDQDQQDFETDPDEWIRREVLPVLDALEADPSSGLTVEEVFASLEEKREERQKAS